MNTENAEKILAVLTDPESRVSLNTRVHIRNAGGRVEADIAGIANLIMMGEGLMRMGEADGGGYYDALRKITDWITMGDDKTSVDRLIQSNGLPRNVSAEEGAAAVRAFIDDPIPDPWGDLRTIDVLDRYQQEIGIQD